MCLIVRHEALMNVHRNGITGHTVVTHIGVNIARRRRKATRTMSPSGPEMGIVTRPNARDEVFSFEENVKNNNINRIFHNVLSMLSSFDDANIPHMKANSGATKTYLKPAHMTYLKKVMTLLDPN